MHVQMTTPRGHVVTEPCDTIDHGHCWTPSWSDVTLALNPIEQATAMPDDMLINDPTGGIPRLLAIMRALRDPQTGCPWDIEQDFATIAPYTIEEAYEVADAIEREEWDELKGELGDLLLQVVFHGQIAADKGLFDFAQIADAISDKMVARHPHVFGSESRDKSAAQQTRDWETVKAAERAGQDQRGTLDGVAAGLPALMRAVKLQKRAARVGFDWPETTQVLDKLAEEISELTEAAATEDPDHTEEEFGDMLFVMANLARHMKIDPEVALRRANAKFTRRFQRIESLLAKTGKSPLQSDLAEMDALWTRAKAEERGKT
jgi:ATP diphosphatase